MHTFAPPTPCLFISSHAAILLHCGSRDANKHSLFYAFMRRKEWRGLRACTPGVCADLEAQQRQARRAQQMFQPDNFSIDSKDSCKPEKCESPLKCPGDRAARNGQGTDPPLRPNAQLEERIAQLRSVKEDL
eukprot:jgi/Ulvmu1/9598/UM054_0028.1